MLQTPEYDLIVEAIRALILIAVPVTLVLAVAGTMITALQSASAMQEHATKYAARALAFIACLYFLLPPASRLLIGIAETAFGVR